MFARRAGQRDVPPIAMGSHLDTQPTGGKFDGVLGVLAALEALRALVEAGYETYAPIEVVNWTNEEGSRFAPATLGSGVFGGAFAHDWAWARKDRAGVRFGDALAAIGYRGAERCGAHPLSAFFELHIEQGPILEAEAKEIGIVTGVQGIRWFEGTDRGAGGAYRRDAHAAAQERARSAPPAWSSGSTRSRTGKPPLAVATVGLIEVKPNSRNVVPGEVFFTVDLRHPESAVLDEMEQAIAAGGERGVRSARACPAR